MPVIKSAIKKMRQARKKTGVNRVVRDNLVDVIKKYKKSPTVKGLSGLFTVVDKAAKRKVIHVNKASRIKSRMTKLLGTKSAEKTSKPKSRKTGKK